MIRMKNFLILILLSMFSMVGAQPEKSLTLKTIIPEDYGITVPDVLKLDRLVFAIRLEDGNTSLVERNLIDTGISNEGDNSMEIVLLYYGNLETPYDVYLRVDPGLGFVCEDGPSYAPTFPVHVALSQPEEFMDNAELDVYDDGFARLTVLPNGPIRGEEAVLVSLGWDAGRNMPPGKYSAEIWLSLLVN